MMDRNTSPRPADHRPGPLALHTATAQTPHRPHEPSSPSDAPGQPRIRGTALSPHKQPARATSFVPMQHFLFRRAQRMDRAYRHRRSAVPWKIGFPCRQGGSLDKRALLAVAYGRRLEQSAFVRKRALSGICGALGMALTTSASAVASGCSGRSRRIVTF